ncbi:MAG: BON domain-containing protein [Thermoguttaceae bacterium]|nr:BON domain-containing protein [Thermoguttaceae bacterium]MDW8079873.1 BON domain-containing protein [Thermoguttaceae bacterium]
MEVKTGPMLGSTRSPLGSGGRQDRASDAARLIRAIEDAILEATYGGVRNLSVDVTSREVILRGRCRSYHVKQMAQHAAMRMCEDLDIVNEIQVVE